MNKALIAAGLLAGSGTSMALKSLQNLQDMTADAKGVIKNINTQTKPVVRLDANGKPYAATAGTVVGDIGDTLKSIGSTSDAVKGMVSSGLGPGSVLLDKVNKGLDWGTDAVNSGVDWLKGDGKYYVGGAGAGVLGLLALNKLMKMKAQSNSEKTKQLALEKNKGKRRPVTINPGDYDIDIKSLMVPRETAQQ